MDYQVLEAKNGKMALAAIDDIEEVDLLLTDVVMPGGMSGPALAEEAATRHAGIKVLFMSGYAQDSMRRHDQRNDVAPLLQKPFRKTELAHMLRSVLDT